jgi:4-amino-4-deoxychorismate lyase
VRVRYLIGPDASVDVNDRGLAYGDGLFETMAIRRGQVARLALHLDRLGQGCERLGLARPPTAELIGRIGEQAAGIDAGVLKLIFTRGSGPRGYAPPPQPLPTLILTATPLNSTPARRIDVVMLEQSVGENEKLAGIKHLCRLEQVLGQLELSPRGADEGIMRSTSGHIIGGTSRNLFAVFGDRLVTPVLSRAGIAGVMRRSVMDYCHSTGRAVEEAELGADDLAHADELFMTNAIVGIQSVASLDRRPYPADSMAARLRTALALDADA